MTAPPPTASRDAASPAPVPRRSLPARLVRDPLVAPALLAAALVALLLGRGWLVDRFDVTGVSTWTTVFVAVVVQALPFLALGVVLSAVLTVYVPAGWITRALPRHPVGAVCAAGASGAVLPGCECASVPLAGGLLQQGVPQGAALAFLLSAPAINPVVLVATAVAFPGEPEMVLGRLVASLAAAVVVALLWSRFAPPGLLRLPVPVATTGPRAERFRATTEHDLLHAGGWLVVGAAVAATVNVVVPAEVVDAVASQPLLAVLALAVLAVLVAICSEADAFVAASFSQFSPTAQLAFMVVGPMVDVKLVAMQAGWFGRRFAARFAPLTFVVALGAALLVGTVLL
jgi:hypothetical protein